MLAGLGRVVQDLLLWCTAEFGYLRLSDGFVQCSSIMPQKRNPVALEHARAIASKAVGQATAILLARPQHALRRHRRHRGRPAAARVLDVQGCGARRAPGRRGDERGEFDRARARASARAGLDHRHRAGRHAGARPRRAVQAAHAIAARFVAGCAAKPEASRAAVLRDVTRRVLGRAIELTDEQLARILSARNFVDVRRTPGGPAPAVTGAAIEASTPHSCPPTIRAARSLRRRA